MAHNISENRFYVYILLDPRKGVSTPFYVGKGSRNRKMAHFNPSSMRLGKNRFKDAIIKKIREADMNVGVFVMRDQLTETEAFDLEKELISHYGRRCLGTGILTNLTDGGEGASGASPERREQMRKQMSGSGSPTFGVGHTTETKQKMSIARKEYIARVGPTRHSDERKARLRENNPGGKSLRKQVVQLDQSGIVVNRYDSVKMAIELTGISSAHMNKRLRPRSLAVNGFLYRHADYDVSQDELQTCFVKQNNAAYVSISKVSKSGNVVSVYNTIRDAANDHPHIPYQTLWKSVKNKVLCGDHYWMKL